MIGEKNLALHYKKSESEVGSSGSNTNYTASISLLSKRLPNKRVDDDSRWFLYFSFQSLVHQFVDSLVKSVNSFVWKSLESLTKPQSTYPETASSHAAMLPQLTLRSAPKSQTPNILNIRKRTARKSGILQNPISNPQQWNIAPCIVRKTKNILTEYNHSITSDPRSGIQRLDRKKRCFLIWTIPIWNYLTLCRTKCR